MWRIGARKGKGMDARHPTHLATKSIAKLAVCTPASKAVQKACFDVAGRLFLQATDRVVER